MASPAEIVRACLVAQGLVVAPVLPGQTLAPIPIPGDGETLCFVGSQPDDPDQIVTIWDQAGLMFGRLQRGKTLSHPGIKIIVRTLDYSGYSLMVNLAKGLDAIVAGTVSVPVDDVNNETHYIQSVYRTSDIISVGEERDKKRQLWSLHARLAFQDQENFMG